MPNENCVLRWLTPHNRNRILWIFIIKPLTISIKTLMWLLLLYKYLNHWSRFLFCFVWISLRFVISHSHRTLTVNYEFKQFECRVIIELYRLNIFKCISSAHDELSVCSFFFFFWLAWTYALNINANAIFLSVVRFFFLNSI